MIKRFIRYVLGRKDRMAQSVWHDMEAYAERLRAEAAENSARLEAAHEACCSPAARATDAHNLKRLLEKETRP